MTTLWNEDSYSLMVETMICQNHFFNKYSYTIYYVVTISARGFILWHLCQVIYYIFHLSAHVEITLDSEYCHDIGFVSDQ